MIVSGVISHLVLAALSAMAAGRSAEASFIVNITQSGSDIVATGSGSIITSGLTDGGSTSKPYALIVANYDGQGLIVLGSTTGEEEFDGPIAGPALGPGGPFAASSSGGNPVGLDAGDGLILVPVG